MVNNIHIGNLIQEKVKEKNISVVNFAKMLNCDRTNIYRIYNRKSIDVELLERISINLKTDFFKIYSIDIENKIFNNIIK